jgi:quinol monooxygenase YgiN
MSERQIVIVAYKPKPGHEEELLQLTREHVPLLREEELATDRSVIACQAADGTVIEVFEWEPGAIERAHTNPRVQELWQRYEAACDYVPLQSLPETAQMFASFKPVELG